MGALGDTLKVGVAGDHRVVDDVQAFGRFGAEGGNWKAAAAISMSKAPAFPGLPVRVSPAVVPSVFFEGAAAARVPVLPPLSVNCSAESSSLNARPLSLSIVRMTTALVDASSFFSGPPLFSAAVTVPVGWALTSILASALL